MTKEHFDETPALTRQKRTSGIKEKRVRGADGQIKTMRIVDLSSPTLDDDLTDLFRRNVEKARRDNKRVIGSADGLAIKK